MIRNSFFLTIFALSALVCLCASPAAAERLQRRHAQGNNFGMQVSTGWGMPWTGNNWQFPKGSGNYIGNGGMTMAPLVTKDLDGDGAPDDTSGINHIRAMMPALSSLESIDLLTSLANAGSNMETVPGLLQYNRIWTSLDAGELEDWPVEGRVGHTAAGEPDVAAGGETLFFHSGDTFNGWGTIEGPCGIYMGWTLRFLDFAESNNMCYGHVYMRNMSEYIKWSGNSGYAANGAAHPNGSIWHGMLMINNMRGVTFGGEAAGWMLHPELRISGCYPLTPTIGSFTPPEGPLLGFKMIHPPAHNGEQMDLTALHVMSFAGTEYGFTGTKQIFVGFPWGVTYRAAMDLPEDPPWYPGVINPITGREMKSAWPGRVEPGDATYSQWIFGGDNPWMHYQCYGELHDVAPRDSMSMDWAYMMVYPGVKPFITPTFVTANMGDQSMQDGFAPLAHYAEVAEIVIDGGYVLPATPVGPPLTIIPGDREVSITWSDVNLQTPDPYYSFLEEVGLNPEGYYKEYDLEGYRVYRSFVGPNDSHSELLEDFNKSSGNLQFYYIDRMEDDVLKNDVRMRNGMKVWYSVVPYDKNYDVATGEAFSLPDPSSGKTWNRPAVGYYSVIPRSAASEFRPASLGAAGIVYDGQATTAASSVELAGDGTGKLTEAPQWLQPEAGNVTFMPVNNERITADKTIYVECSSAWHDGGGCSASRPYGRRKIKLVDGAYEMVAGSELSSNSDDTQSLGFSGAADDEGVNYALEVSFMGLNRPNNYRNSFIHNIDPGTYTGTVETVTRAGCGPTSRMGSAPSIAALVRNGRFTVTWKASGSDMTVEVQNVTRGTTLPAVTYGDEDGGWGFMTPEENGGEIAAPGSIVNGIYYDEAFKDNLPISERTAQMLDKIPADYADMFGLWVNYMVWKISGGVPADGTVWTIDYAWGSWNADQTVFTQVADLPSPGVDKWKIEIKAMSMDPEKADLSRVKVVPNPYMGSSFLDLSPSNRRIEFVNLPGQCTIRIYTLGGNLVNVLNHIGINRQGWANYTDYDRLTLSEPKVFTGYDNHGGTEAWNLRNRFGQLVASGLYFFNVTDSRGKTHTGKFYVIN